MASSVKISNANGKIVTIENNDSNMSDVTLNGASITKKVDTLANMRAMGELPETVWCSGYHSENDGAFGSHFYRLKGLKTTEIDNGGTVIVVSIGGSDYVYELQYDGAVNVKWFGAVSDGITDNTPVFRIIASYVNSLGGNTILEFPNDGGTYRYGQAHGGNSFNPTYTDDTSFYGRGSIMLFGNIDGLTIIGNKANVKAMDGIHFGSFDDQTGLAMPSIQTAAKYSNGGGEFFGFYGDNSNISIKDINIDGNNDAKIIGAQFGDTGYQVSDHGVVFVGFLRNAYINNCSFNNFGTDGMQFALTNAVENASIYVNNVQSEYNGRQGISIVGGSHIQLNNCSFSHTGKGIIYSAPGAGVDIEPEGRTCKNNVFMGCSFHNNTGASVLITSADASGNIFNSCSLIGTTASTVYAYGNTTFDNCEIRGGCTVVSSSKFFGCNFSDRATALYPTIWTSSYFMENFNVGSIQDNCTYSMENGVRLFWYAPNVTNAIIYVYADTDVHTSYNIIGFLGPGCSNFYLYDYMTGSGIVGFSAPSSEIIVYNGHLLQYPEVYRGRGPRFGGAKPTITSALHIGANEAENLNSRTKQITMKSYAFNTGFSYVNGDIIYYATVGPSGNMGEICTTSGLYGSTAVFKPFGAISA